MDVINEQNIKQVIIDPALTRIDTETIPALQAAIAADGDRIMGQASNVIAGILQGIQATADKLVADLNSTVKSLDGWTVEIGEIRIPAITIRLTSPK